MSCTRCNGMDVNDQFYDRVDEKGHLRLGAWRWASRCPACGTMVYDCVDSPAAEASTCSDPTKPILPTFGRSNMRHEGHES